MMQARAAIAISVVVFFVGSFAFVYFKWNSGKAEGVTSATLPNFSKSHAEQSAALARPDSRGSPTIGDPARQQQKNLPTLPKTPLQSLIDDALVPGKSPDSRELVLNLSHACLNAISMPAVPASDLQAVNAISSDQANAVEKEHQQARKQLTDFCATGNATELVDRLKQAKLPISGPIQRSLAQRRSGARSQEYFQAATQVLANPAAYAVQFDFWLSRDLDVQLQEKRGLSAAQSLHVQDVLYSDFVSANDYNAYRVMQRCGLFAVCPAGVTLTAEQSAQAQRVADEIRLAIQQQQWGSLISK
jgi:hypothetical protein